MKPVKMAHYRDSVAQPVVSPPPRRGSRGQFERVGDLIAEADIFKIANCKLVNPKILHCKL